MEDTDEISDSEVTPDLDFRLSEIEKVIRTFRIAHAGTGMVGGGFPQLRRSNDWTERLQNAEHSVQNFALETGDDVTYSGDLEHGFIVTVPPCPQTTSA